MQSSQGLRCRDLGSDRKIGSYWEDRFIEMAVEQYGCTAEGKQKGKSLSAVAMSPNGGLILPDTQVSKQGTTIVPEVKHKDPTRHGQYGDEEYRLDDLVEYSTTTGLQVILAIHDHSLAGGKHVTQNHVCHWRWQDVLVLNEKCDHRAPGFTWCGGKKVTRFLRYWNVDRFLPLRRHPFFEVAKNPFLRRDASRPSSQRTLFSEIM